jgi:hypothetical protein
MSALPQSFFMVNENARTIAQIVDQKQKMLRLCIHFLVIRLYLVLNYVCGKNCLPMCAYMTVPVILRFSISKILKTVIIYRTQNIYYLNRNIALTLYPLISTAKRILNKKFCMWVRVQLMYSKTICSKSS